MEPSDPLLMPNPERLGLDPVTGEIVENGKGRARCIAYSSDTGEKYLGYEGKWYRYEEVRKMLTQSTLGAKHTSIDNMGKWDIMHRFARFPGVLWAKRSFFG